MNWVSIQKYFSQLFDTKVEEFFLALNTIKYIFREECSDKGGTNDGTCASGYGICCTCKFLNNIKYYLSTLVVNLDKVMTSF